jgi:hypothetical protein
MIHTPHWLNKAARKLAGDIAERRRIEAASRIRESISRLPSPREALKTVCVGELRFVRNRLL